ncbi:MAG: Gx transporter family protein, partial [Coriobacteriia bacterium]|nr:Gx transporter family protein [Coriobacteriia bacterium]
MGSSLLALACVIGLVEAWLPGVPFAPWLRLGLANIAVVIALIVSGARTAVVVGLGRIAIVGLATGTLATPVFAISLAGALASLAAMWTSARYLKGLSPVGWSAAGSAAHVLAQFVAAGMLLGTGSLMVLAPPSVLVAVFLGALVGYLS